MNLFDREGFVFQNSLSKKGKHVFTDINVLKMPRTIIKMFLYLT